MVENAIKGENPIFKFPAAPPKRNDESIFIWYVGIGSMMNKNAIELRKIYPTHSLACRLPGFKRVFSSVGGMANLVIEEGETTHAVVHRITEAELKSLEGREPPSQYICAIIDSEFQDSKYNGKKVQVAASIRYDTAFGIDGKPTERYKMMMLEGAKIAKMKQNGIEQIEQYDFTPFPNPPKKLPIFQNIAMKKFTRKELKGQLDYVIFHNKVLKVDFDMVEETNKAYKTDKSIGSPLDLHGKGDDDGEKTSSSSSSSNNNNMKKSVEKTTTTTKKTNHNNNNDNGKTHSDKSFSVRRYNGADITPFVTTQYYNPRFGLPKSNKSNEEYWQWLENHMTTFFLRFYKVCGSLVEEDIIDAVKNTKL